ncbi:MAG: hypothetical protein IT182_02080 [Acidobacteria bacterium]|nr:hypothetical protein [Acidobacteriota bacterium]
MPNFDTPETVDRPPVETEFARDLYRSANHALTVAHLIEKRLDAAGAVTARIAPHIASLRAGIHAGTQGAWHDALVYRSEHVITRWTENHRRPLQVALRAAGKVEQELDLDVESAAHAAMQPQQPQDVAAALVLELRRGEIRKALGRMKPGEAQLRVIAAADSGMDRDTFDAWLSRPSLSGLPIDVTSPSFVDDIARRVRERVAGYESPTNAALSFLRQVIAAAEAVAKVGTVPTAPALSVYPVQYKG